MNIPQQVTLLQLPFDANSSFMQGPSLGPALIRSALFSPSANSFAEDGTDLYQHPGWQDGDRIDTEDYHQIANQLNVLLPRQRIFCLGGDHSLAYPIIKAHAAQYGPINILQFDAHADLYDELDGNKYSHACPFARIMEEGLAKRLVQVGIRCMTSHLWDQAKKFGVEVIEMKNLDPITKLKWEGPLYITVDLDVLDPAFAPGVSHHEPGGLSTRQLIHYIQQIKVPILGADIMEYNPARDINGLTAMVGAKILKELLAKML